MTKTNKNVLFLRGIPPDLKHLFKVWCVTNGVTMTHKIEELMREVIDSGDTHGGNPDHKGEGNNE